MVDSRVTLSLSTSTASVRLFGPQSLRVDWILYIWVTSYAGIESIRLFGLVLMFSAESTRLLGVCMIASIRLDYSLHVCDVWSSAFIFGLKTMRLLGLQYLGLQ